MQTWPQWVKLIAFAVCLVAAYIGMGLMVILMELPIMIQYGMLGSEPFDSVRWKEHGNNQDDCLRYRMWHDLKNRNLVEGLTATEVGELLGPPGRIYPMVPPNEYYYWISPLGGWPPLDSEWMTVEFDVNGYATGTGYYVD